jgi:hypothetical protein
MRRGVYLTKNLALYYAFPKVYVQRVLVGGGITTLLYFYEKKCQFLNILKNQIVGEDDALYNFDKFNLNSDRNYKIENNEEIYCKDKEDDLKIKININTNMNTDNSTEVRIEKKDELIQIINDL